jgi:hypothetical protein
MPAKRNSEYVQDDTDSRSAALQALRDAMSEDVTEADELLTLGVSPDLSYVS